MAGPWTGAFIGAPTPAEEGDPAAYLRRGFVVEPGLRSAVLHVSGLGIVVPFVNGDRVGDEVLAPGWTSYRHRVGVRAHDVTALLSTGENALGVLAGEGWAVGRLGWEGKRAHYTDRPAVFVELHLHYDDRVDRVVSGPEFRVGGGGVRAGSLYDGETFDARLEPAGWSEAGFDDSAWAPAVVVDWPLEALELDAAPPIRRIEELPVVSVRRAASGAHLVDFGQNLSGWVRLTVTGEAGTLLTLRFAELLTPAGELEPDTNRTAEATDRYVLRGGEEETWEPQTTFHGFRFVEIDGWPGELDPAALRAIVVHSDMQRTGWFESSEPLLDRLHENAVWSMRDNFVGVPTDCPQRDERLGWTGDLNAFAPTAVSLYDVRAVLASWLTDLALEQAEKGYVPWVVPDVLPTPSGAAAIWSDVAISLPWTLYQEYGDLEILRRSYDSMAAFLRQVEGQLDARDLWSSGFQFGDWLDPDAPYDEPSAGKTDRYLVACAFLARTSRELADTAALLETEDAAHFEELALRVRAAFRREYVAPSGRLVGETVTAYALALCFDLFAEDQLERAGDRLAALVAGAGFRISTGFAGTPYVAEALSRTGHLDEAYLLLLQRESPSFLAPVLLGATTTWERWDALGPDGALNGHGMTSLNHYALGSIARWLHTTIGGLRSLAPGWSRAQIAPQPGGGLTSARVVHDSVRGRFEVSWRTDGETVGLDVTVPDGVEAVIVLPLHPDGERHDVVGGTHSWSYRVPGLGRRAGLALDTPLGDIGRHRATWYAIAGLLERAFPGMSLDPASPDLSGLPLSALLGHLPTVPDGLEDELRAVLAAA